MPAAASCRDNSSDAATRSIAAHECGCIEIAEHDIGVGNRRGHSAVAVTGRARDRARAFRPDPQRAAAIDARNRAAAGRDARDVEAAQRDALAGEHAVVRQRGVPVRDQRNVGRGSAHVERDEIRDAEQVGATPPARHAAGRPRQYRACRQPRSFLDRRHATMRQHDKQTASKSSLGKTLRETGEITPYDRFDIGVHDRGRDALIFLDLRQYVARSRHADSGQCPGETLDRGKLVDRIEIGMQETHCDRSRAGFANGGDGLVERGLIERNQNVAVGFQPLADAKAQFARHQGLRRRRTQIVAVGLEALAHFDDVAMTFGGK
jgi:hypothetical protein